MPREFTRNVRLGAQMHRTLSELIRFETKDPGLADVSLTVQSPTQRQYEADRVVVTIEEEHPKNITAIKSRSRLLMSPLFQHSAALIMIPTIKMLASIPEVAAGPIALPGMFPM